MTCQDCKYSKPQKLDVVFCRRFPPSFRSNGQVIGIAFPTLRKTEWCGEWSQKSPAMPVDIPSVDSIDEPLDQMSVDLLVAVSQNDTGSGVSSDRLWEVLGWRDISKVFEIVEKLERSGYCLVTFSNYIGELKTFVGLSSKGQSVVDNAPAVP